MLAHYLSDDSALFLGMMDGPQGIETPITVVLIEHIDLVQRVRDESGRNLGSVRLRGMERNQVLKDRRPQKRESVMGELALDISDVGFNAGRLVR